MGLNSQTRKRWGVDRVESYATCEVPSMFENALGGRCFSPWGYAEGGVGSPNQFTHNYRRARWESEADLDTPGFYSVATRNQLPGSGFVKTLANRSVCRCRCRCRQQPPDTLDPFVWGLVGRPGWVGG